MQKEKRKLPQKRTADRYGVSLMTLYRWRKNKALGFPSALYINGRVYFDEEELEAWERDRAAKQGAALSRNGEGAAHG